MIIDKSFVAVNHLLYTLAIHAARNESENNRWVRSCSQSTTSELLTVHMKQQKKLGLEERLVK